MAKNENVPIDFCDPSNAVRAQNLVVHKATNTVLFVSACHENETKKIKLSASLCQHARRAPNVSECVRVRVEVYIKWPCVLLWLYFASLYIFLVSFTAFLIILIRSDRKIPTRRVSIWVEIGDLIKGLGFYFIFYVVVVFVSFRFVRSFGVDVFWICFSFIFFSHCRRCCFFFFSSSSSSSFLYNH